MKTLGEWPERAGDHEDEVPTEVWQRIADAAARVLAAAAALAKQPVEEAD